MALANPVELLSQRELGKSIEEFVPLDPGRSRAWTASLWDFLYDRTLQERCGGVASGRGFEAGGCRQDHRPVIILQGRRANGATFVAIVKIAERTIRQSKRAEESSSNSTDGAVGRIDAKMVSVS